MEIVAVVFSLLCVYLTSKQSIWSWPIGMIGVIFYFFIFLHVELYAEMCLQVIFFCQSLYGWYNWRKNNMELVVSKMSDNRTLALIISSSVLSILLILFFKEKIDSSFPELDVVTTVGSLVANTLLIFKKIDAWFYWITVDILMIILFILSGLYLSAILYVIFLVMSINGLVKWSNKLIDEKV